MSRDMVRRVTIVKGAPQTLPLLTFSELASWAIWDPPQTQASPNPSCSAPHLPAAPGRGTGTGVDRPRAVAAAAVPGRARVHGIPARLPGRRGRRRGAGRRRGGGRRRQCGAAAASAGRVAQRPRAGRFRAVWASPPGSLPGRGAALLAARHCLSAPPLIALFSDLHHLDSPGRTSPLQFTRHRPHHRTSCTKAVVSWQTCSRATPLQLRSPPPAARRQRRRPAAAVEAAAAARATRSSHRSAGRSRWTTPAWRPHCGSTWMGPQLWSASRCGRQGGLGGWEESG